MGPVSVLVSVQSTGCCTTAHPVALTLHLAGESEQASTLANTPSLSKSAHPAAFTERPVGVPSHRSSKSFTPSPSVSRSTAAHPRSSTSVAFAGVIGQSSSGAPVAFTSGTVSLSSSSSSVASKQPSPSKSVALTEDHPTSPLGHASLTSITSSLSSLSSSSKSEHPSLSQSL